MPSIVPILAKEELAQLPTKALLGRLRRLQACEESLALSDRDAPSSCQIEFKATALWRSAYAELKAVLATREHVAKGAERRAVRVARAKKRLTSRRPATEPRFRP